MGGQFKGVNVLIKFFKRGRKFHSADSASSLLLFFASTCLLTRDHLCTSTQWCDVSRWPRSRDTNNLASRRLGIVKTRFNTHLPDLWTDEWAHSSVHRSGRSIDQLGCVQRCSFRRNRPTRSPRASILSRVAPRTPSQSPSPISRRSALTFSFECAHFHSCSTVRVSYFFWALSHCSLQFSQRVLSDKQSVP